MTLTFNFLYAFNFQYLHSLSTMITSYEKMANDENKWSLSHTHLHVHIIHNDHKLRENKTKTIDENKWSLSYAYAHAHSFHTHAHGHAHTRKWGTIILIFIDFLSIHIINVHSFIKPSLYAL